MAKHLSANERDQIAQLSAQGFRRSEIARRLGRDRSTIGREFQRNCSGGCYHAIEAHQRAVQRRATCRRPCKMDDPRLNEMVRTGLTQFWSPQQIAGRFKREHRSDRHLAVSHETIYRWIRKSENREHWQGFLRRRGKRPPRKRSQNAAENRAIANRPRVIERRGRLGDLEGDTILGCRNTGAIVTLVDRKSHYTRMAKVKAKTACRVHKAIRHCLHQAPEGKIKSITLDNGTEFALAHRLEQTSQIEVYWAEPGRPHQRGTNENTNGLVRQFFPKGSDFRLVYPRDVARVEKLLNFRPRACLGFRTPHEVEHGTSLNLCCVSS